ncbi:MAG: type II toxin-antitoxin system HicB family antitoxin [Coriobacteriia bacterium]|nr:type II toxin-antitoxin system HicB family antitoxin [Coriobacteriia bacterium]
MRYTYRAIFEAEKGGGYSISFPDIPAICTCGDDFADAVDMAADALELWIASQQLDGKPLPKATFETDADSDSSVLVSVCPRPAAEVVDEFSPHAQR